MGKASRMKKQKVEIALTEEIVETVSVAINEDDLSRLAEGSAIAARIKKSIWDVRIIIKDVDGTGVRLPSDPLFAAMVVGSKRCFDRLLNESGASPSGRDAAGNLFMRVIPFLDAMPTGSTHYEMVESVVLAIAKQGCDSGPTKKLQSMFDAAKSSSRATVLLNHFFAEKEAIRQKAVLEHFMKGLSKAASVGEIEVPLVLEADAIEPNQDAIVAAGAAVEAAKESSRPRSKSKSI